MAAQYLDEEEAVWKCPKHPSRRRRTGICHVCLKERLSSLCPNCANPRPCPCQFSSSSSTASSSSSSSGMGAFGQSEPSFRRSRSLAVPFLRSSKPESKTSPSVWSLFKSGNGNKSKQVEAENEEEGRTMMRKSRSVAMTSGADVIKENINKGKGRRWHFPSPIKVLKQSVWRGLMVRERSPLRRG